MNTRRREKRNCKEHIMTLASIGKHGVCMAQGQSQLAFCQIDLTGSCQLVQLSSSTHQRCQGSVRWKYREHMSLTSLTPSSANEIKIVLLVCSDQEILGPNVSCFVPKQTRNNVLRSSNQELRSSIFLYSMFFKKLIKTLTTVTAHINVNY